MTKQEAIEYIKLHSRPFHLEKECLDAFNSFVNAIESLGGTVNYYKEANDALYEWDI